MYIHMYIHTNTYVDRRVTYKAGSSMAPQVPHPNNQRRDTYTFSVLNVERPKPELQQWLGDNG